ncbi:hypothetical protein V1525DRAFT_415709 [Lipomyces kononenkoae]|uniref:Uncharacterized protein n=1 Tax=Lipomyces kononenkoae TaxID=34357 RepID=A0ACC3SQN7_LIPKO
MDAEVAMSNLFATMSASIVRDNQFMLPLLSLPFDCCQILTVLKVSAGEIRSETPIEGLFVLKKGDTFYYHGTCEARRMLNLQYEGHRSGQLNNIFTQLNSYLALKDSGVLPPTILSDAPQAKRMKPSIVKDRAMREAFNKLLAQATNQDHPDPLQFRSFNTLESELANRGFKLNFEANWTWTTFQQAYKCKSTISATSIIEALGKREISIAAISAASSTTEDDLV